MLQKIILNSATKTTPFFAQVAARRYHENVLDHFENPRNKGSLDKMDPSVGTGLVGAPACGDVMKLQIQVAEDGKIERAVFKVSVFDSLRHSDVEVPLLVHLTRQKFCRECMSTMQ
jgi:hypothetical protein